MSDDDEYYRRIVSAAKGRAPEIAVFSLGAVTPKVLLVVSGFLGKGILKYSMAAKAHSLCYGSKIMAVISKCQSLGALGVGFGLAGCTGITYVVVYKVAQWSLTKPAEPEPPVDVGYRQRFTSGSTLAYNKTASTLSPLTEATKAFWYRGSDN